MAVPCREKSYSFETYLLSKLSLDRTSNEHTTDLLPSAKPPYLLIIGVIPRSVRARSLGHNNTADGLLALENNTIGHDNIAERFQALAYNTTGSSNIAPGSNAGINLATGSNNIDIGAPGVAGG